MKKIISALLVAVCLCMALPSQAQLRWGVKAGLNLNKADFSGLKENFKAENKAGYFFGPMLDFTLPIGRLGFDASLLYSQKSAKIEYTPDDPREATASKTSRQHAIDIPINLKYSIGMGDMASVFVTAGPDFSFNLKSDDVFKGIADLAGETIGSGVKSTAKKADIGINVGLGAKLINCLQIAVNYNIPLGNSNKATVSDKNLDTILTGDVFKKKNKMWQVSLAYMF